MCFKEKMKLILIGNDSVLLKKNEGGLGLPYVFEVTLAESESGFRFNDYLALPSDGENADDPECVVMGIREAWGLLPEDDYAAVVKGAELINWSRDERFCSHCGCMLQRATTISKKCPGCGREYFPQLSPAIVVLVKKGDEALLVHARNFRRQEMMALVAGFVETGESLEQCVAREIKEETDIEVTDIRYVGSQSWPFPHQLMLGFTAEYAGGEVRFADGELSAGGFFSKDDMPAIPTPPSLSREIIDRWLAGEL